MKEIITHTYQCESCSAVHDTIESARACEASPIETVDLAIGDFVGDDVHGWWNEDTSWTLSQKSADYFDARKERWGRSPAGPFLPGHYAFLPIWRVVAIQRVPREHRLKFLLWTPRHSNRVKLEAKCTYGEGLTYTYSSGHTYPFKIPEKFHPRLSEKEEARYRALVENPEWSHAGLV